MKILSRLSHIIRFAFLFGGLCGACVLWNWNRTADPRFYYFLETQPGKILGSISGWDIFNAREDKSKHEMTSLELGYMRSIEKVVNRQYPTHILYLNNGEEVRGQLLGQNENLVKFRPVVGARFAQTVEVPRRHITALFKNTEIMLPVTYRDVQFKMEFPEFAFFRNGAYTVLTDAPETDAVDFVDKLKALNVDFTDTFSDLMRPGDEMRDIQVLYVYKKSQFNATRDMSAIHPADATGLFIPKKDRLIIYRQEQFAQVEEPVVEKPANVAVAPRHVHLPADGPSWLGAIKPQIHCRQHAAFALTHPNETELTLRHEGAHHLMFKYGIHSSFRAENPWLIEGLACYFESEVPGDIVETYRRMIEWGTRNNEFIPLEELVNYRSGDGMVDSSTSARVDMSYAESWALVRFLMQPEYQPGFFNYLRFVRKPSNLSVLGGGTRSELLAAKLGLSPAELDNRWLDYLHQMIK